MLGIIFTGGKSPLTQVIKKLIDGIKKDIVFIAADSGLEAMQNSGITPDWVVGDFDSLDDKSRLDCLQKERIIRFDHDKDYTDTELAISLAVEKSCNEIWIIGGGGGRMDHLFALRSLFERELFPGRWITDNEDIRCIQAGDLNCDLSLNLEKNALVSVFPLGAGPWEAESKGLKWQLKGLPWDRGFFGISNLAAESGVSITAIKGRFMVILPVRGE